MKIRINDKNQTTIAECVMTQDEYGNWLLVSSENIEDIFVDMEQDDKIGFVDTFDIDIKTEKVEK